MGNLFTFSEFEESEQGSTRSVESTPERPYTREQIHAMNLDRTPLKDRFLAFFRPDTPESTPGSTLNTPFASPFTSPTKPPSPSPRPTVSRRLLFTDDKAFGKKRRRRSNKKISKRRNKRKRRSKRKISKVFRKVFRKV